MGFDLNWMIYLSQIAVGCAVVGGATLAVCGMMGFFRCLQVSTQADDPFPNIHLRPWAWFGGALLAISILVPSQSTIIYSAALDYGPEYAERLLRVIEGSK